MNPTRLVATALFACAVAFLVYCLQGGAGAHDDEDTGLASDTGDSPEPAPEPPPLEMVHVIRRGETLGAILPEYGVPVAPVVAAADGVYDLSRIRTGRELVFVLTPESSVPVELRYALDEDRTLVVAREGDAWSARVDEIVYEHRVGTREFSVETSLWSAAVDAGLQAADIAGLARVYEYDIDFNTEVRPGAVARMVVEELWLDGAFVRLSPPLATRFENAGKEYLAVRFEHEDGRVVYYDGDGVARKKAFLRSPIEFSRVTSGFSLKRFHPILKKSRPHLGTDFGAPAGTPIRAVGEGKVVFAGRNGGHGKYVKIDHPGAYESSYSHMSSIRVKKGQTVQQGQVIGTVGSTGLSTGPHLHFQFWVNGKIVDPLSVTLPRETRLEGAELQAFQSRRDSLLALFEGVADDGAATDTSLPAASP